MILCSVHGEVARRLPIDGRASHPVRNGDERNALMDLVRAGFLQRADEDSSEAAWRWCGDYPAIDRALLALLARFDLHLEVGLVEDETVWIAAALQEHPGEETHQAFSGTGFGRDDAIRTCLGEFAEFQSWLYRPGDEHRRCLGLELGTQAIEPWHGLGFAPAQRERRSAYNAAWLGYDCIPAADAFEGEIDSTEAFAVRDGARCWIPTQLCFGQYGARVDCPDPNWRSDSNGCAAGPTRDQALAHALLELVERDATGIWWYAGGRRPAVPAASIADDALNRALDARARLGQRIVLLDLTHDLDIPVIAAVLISTDGDLLALGFGCDLDRRRAARSAYREMCQMELAVAFAKRRVAQAGEATRPEDRRLVGWLAQARALPHLQPDDGLVARRSPDVACGDAQIADLVRERLDRAGLQAYAVDLTRPDIGVPAVRAFVPGLCHYKPRLGFKRLVEVPRALGWRNASFGPQDLSDLALLI